jgi:hypothetical protein
MFYKRLRCHLSSCQGTQAVLMTQQNSCARNKWNETPSYIWDMGCSRRCVVISPLVGIASHWNDTNCRCSEKCPVFFRIEEWRSQKIPSKPLTCCSMSVPQVQSVPLLDALQLLMLFLETVSCLVPKLFLLIIFYSGTFLIIRISTVRNMNVPSSRRIMARAFELVNFIIVQMRWFG